MLSLRRNGRFWVRSSSVRSVTAEGRSEVVRGRIALRHGLLRIKRSRIRRISPHIRILYLAHLNLARLAQRNYRARAKIDGRRRTHARPNVLAIIDLNS